MHNEHIRARERERERERRKGEREGEREGVREGVREGEREGEKERAGERELMLSIFRPSSKSLEMEINGRSERKSKKIEKTSRKRKCEEEEKTQIKTIPEWN